MSDHSALIRRQDDIEYESVDAAEGLRKGVLLDDDFGASTFATRRFTLEPGGTVPRHTNQVDHQQYVLDGGYVVGLDDVEFMVEAGDVVFIPAGVVHWYRNESDELGAFLCAVPAGDDRIDIVEE